jgi:hypothetical protein
VSAIEKEEMSTIVAESLLHTHEMSTIVAESLLHTPPLNSVWPFEVGHIIYSFLPVQSWISLFVSSRETRTNIMNAWQILRVQHEVRILQKHIAVRLLKGREGEREREGRGGGGEKEHASNT